MDWIHVGLWPNRLYEHFRTIHTSEEELQHIARNQKIDIKNSSHLFSPSHHCIFHKGK